MGIAGKIGKYGLIGGAVATPVLAAGGAINMASKAGTLKLPKTPVTPTHPGSSQYLGNAGYFNSPSIAKKRNLMKLGELKSRVKKLLKEAAGMPPTAMQTPASLPASGQPTLASPYIAAGKQAKMNHNAIPGAPTNAGAGMPISHLNGEPGAVDIKKMGSADPLRSKLEKKAFVGGLVSRLGTHTLGRIATSAGVGGATAAATGGDPLTGAFLGGFFNPGTAAALGAAGGIATSAMKARNKSWGLPDQEEGMMLGQINPEHYSPSENLGPLSLLSPA